MKDYLTLKDMSDTVDLCHRQIQTRFKDVLEDYPDEQDLILWRSNRWYIHESLTERFNRLRKKREYIWFVTISSKENYDEDCWTLVARDIHKELKKVDPIAVSEYVIELRKDGTHHLHIRTTFEDKRELG